MARAKRTKATTATTTTASDSEGPAVVETNAEAVASDLLTGEPAVSSSTERVRRYRARKKGQQEAEAEPVALEVDEAEIAEAGVMSAALWDMLLVPAAAGRLRELDESGQERLGKAFAPLIKRYMPLLGRWQYEIAAAMALGVTIRESWRTQAEFDAWRAARQAEAEAKRSEAEREGSDDGTT